MEPPQPPAIPEPQRSRPASTSGGAAAWAEPLVLPEPKALSDLAAACAQCQRCTLAESRRHVVVGRGNPAARLLLIGEAPGAEEDASGRPFVGRAGQLLEQLLSEAGLDSERDLYIANVIKCRPPGNRKPSRAEIAACLPWLERQIALQRPQLIGLLGATALEALLGIKGGITKLRGQWLEPVEGRPQPINSAPLTPHHPARPLTARGQGQPLPSDPLPSTSWMNLQDIALMPLLHPSYLLRNPSDQEGTPKWHTQQDFRLIRRRLDGLEAGQV